MDGWQAIFGRYEVGQEKGGIGAEGANIMSRSRGQMVLMDAGRGVPG
jgi:hypothetical protein